jgi:hypothetical protein
MRMGMNVRAGTPVALVPHRRSTMAKRGSTRREQIDTGRSKMFGKRNSSGQFKEMDNVGRSLSADRRQRAKTAVKSGHGDQGDRPRAAVKKAVKKR